MALARHALDAGLPLPRLHQIRTVGEPVTPALREACDAAWGVPVADVYSCQEVGYLATQCPEGGGYHALAETVLLEVVRDDGSPAEPGETGRVLVTSLHNFATPLIRYALGDYATVGGPCACGRGLPLLERVDGRVRNMLRYPDGRRAWPSLRMSRFAEVADVRQVQVVQHALDGLELKVVPGGPLAPGAESALRAVVQEQLGHPFRVEVTRHEHIPRGAGGKFEDFQSRLPEAP
jgi:phenylacetate-CoA ligase